MPPRLSCRMPTSLPGDTWPPSTAAWPPCDGETRRAQAAYVGWGRHATAVSVRRRCCGHDVGVHKVHPCGVGRGRARQHGAPCDRGLCRRGPTTCLVLIAPKVLKPLHRQFRVFHRVLNVPMAEVELDGPRILFRIRQLIPTRMSERFDIMLHLIDTH